MNFTAHIQHSEESFRQLAKVQYNAYCQGTKLILLAITAACLYFGFLRGNGSTASLLVLFLGCWTAMSLQVPAKRNADKMIDLANGNFPSTDYLFLPDAVQITSGEKASTLEYTKLFGFLEDTKFFYLFVSPLAGYMVPKDSISPNELDDFRTMIEKKSELQLERVKGLLAINLKTFLRQRKNMSRKKHY